MLNWLFGRRDGPTPYMRKVMERPWVDPKWAYPPLEPKTLTIFGEPVEFAAHMPDDLMCCAVEYRATVRGVGASFMVANEWRHEDRAADHERDIEKFVLARASA